MNKKIASITILVVGSLLTSLSTLLVAHAQEATSTSSATLAPASTNTLPLGSIKAPKIGEFAPTVGFKVLTTSARTYEFQDSKGRRAYGKTEYFVGINHSSGWGAQAMAVTKGKTYSAAGDDKSAYGAGDPSVSLLHPIYKNSDLKVKGTFRKYFNVTDSAKKADHNHVAYYLNADWTLPRTWKVSNSLVPRTFLKGTYAAGDTIVYADDTTTITTALLPWMRLGAGQVFAFERHLVTENGTSLQIFPVATLTPSENVLIEARWYLPVHKVNVVDDTPERVALNNSQAQLFMQISM
jgi:hypothetical protein